MAWARDIGETCSKCGKPAKVEVLNNRNSSTGFFCRPCGKRKLKDVQKREDEDR